MRKTLRISAVALAVSAGWALPTQASAADAASVQEELAAMRAQMQAMAQRIDSLEAELATAQAQAETANQVAQAATETAVAAKASADKAPPVKVTWKGAPQIEGEGGWKFKLGGRVNIDAGVDNAPNSTGRDDGFGSEVRRARLRAEGSMPGGVGYKIEADFAGSTTILTDAYLSFSHKDLTFKIGQFNTFQGFEELSSSLHTSFMERAALTDAFNFERRIGASVEYEKGDVLLQGGVFTDNYTATPNKNWSVDTRAVYMPKIGDTQLHFGGSFHYADYENGSTIRYRQRPFEHFTSERFIDTRAFSAKSERGIGLETAMISGRFHAAAETYWQKVARTGMPDPTFFGGYVEAGYFLTKGDSRGYKNGVYDRVKPVKGFDKGGIGAIEINARYDHLDLTDAGIVGGTQNAYQFSLNWSQTAYTKIMLDYSRLQYKDAIYPTASGDTSYAVDVVAMRAQIDF
ncbi:MAG: OprO/OprP family phosphate-selective porin [Novosphingobium sp.]